MTPAGRAASSTDPATWSPYAAVEALEHRGFVLNGDGIVCLDLDHCLVNGRLTARGREILARCPGSYVEVSRSGTGLHVWGRGELDGGRVLPGVEVYGTGRYIAVTGRRFRRAPLVLGDLTGVLDWLLA